MRDALANGANVRAERAEIYCILPLLSKVNSSGGLTLQTIQFTLTVHGNDIRQSFGSRFLSREELPEACLQAGKLWLVTPLLESLQALVGVADAVDYAYAVVGDEQGAVRSGGDAYWPAVNESTVGIGHQSGHEWNWIGRGLAVLEGHESYLVASAAGTIP